MLATEGVAPAAESNQVVSDVVTYTSHAYLTPPSAGAPGRFVLIGDTCQLKSDGESPVSCTIVGAGTVTPTGGQARAVITSREGVITLNETYVFTGPTTSSGEGSALEVDIADRGAVTHGTFTGDFVTAPTANPNVLLDRGTITVRENA
jgi:hypothetical protein